MNSPASPDTDSNPKPLAQTSIPSDSQPPKTQQGKTGRRASWLPEWVKQLPYVRLPAPDPKFKLIDDADLNKILVNASPEAAKQINDDLTFLDQELTRFFRDRDAEAANQQNRYRLYQIGYIVLAAIATMLGALQAISITNAREIVPLMAFFETLIALFATYLATITGREPPMQLWLVNRRRAEALRREFFRYLMDMSPYDTLDGYQRRITLSQRAADINRGQFPDNSAS
jgi:hypothetical protein